VPITSSTIPTRLIRLQLGQESTWGQSVAATSILNGLIGLPKITPLVKDVIFDEQRGSLVPSYSSAQVATGGAFDLTGVVTFEDILYVLASAYGLPTPTGNGATVNVSAITATTAKTISANTLANPTVVTTSTAHGLTTGDTVQISGSNSTPPLSGNYPVIVSDTTHFSVPVNCSVAGTAGTVQTPAVVTTATNHGLSTGGYTILAGTNATTPAVNGVWQVCVHDTTHYAIPAFPTGAGTTAGTGSNPATWTFAQPSTSTFTPVAYTMELGNVGSSTATKLTGGLVQQFTIAGDQQKEMTFTAKGFGQTWTGGVTPTAALSYRTTEIALTPEVVFAMDPAGTTAGTTSYPGALINFTLTGDSGLAPYYAAGSKAPTGFTYLKQQLGLKVSMIYSSTLQTAINANLVAGKTAVMQLSAVSGNKAITVNFSGALKADPVYFEDSQGAQMVSLDLDGVYDPTNGYYTAITVLNAVAALA